MLPATCLCAGASGMPPLPVLQAQPLYPPAVQQADGHADYKGLYFHATTSHAGTVQSFQEALREKDRQLRHATHDNRALKARDRTKQKRIEELQRRVCSSD